MKILLLTPDAVEGRALQAGLADFGCGCEVWVEPPLDAHALTAHRSPPDIDGVLLDAAWPRAESGYRRCAGGASLGPPVIALLPACDMQTLQRALLAGADDALFRPLRIGDILLRLRVWKWRNARRSAASVVLGSLHIDVGARTATKAGEPVHLTAAEWRLLTLVLRRRGTTVTHSELSAQLLDQRAGASSNRVGVHVSNLRRKLGHAWIQTDHGLGYRVPL